MNPAQPYVWMLISSFAFSWMGTLTQLAGNGCPWQATAIVRCLIPLAVVALWARVAGVRLALWGPAALWWRSLAGSCSLVGTFYALDPAHGLQLTEVYTVANMFPIWVALLSWPLLGKPPGLGVWVCVLSGVLGVVAIMQPRLAEGNYTLLVMIAVSLFTALALMGLHRLQHLDPRAVVAHFSGTALAFSLVAMLVFPTDVKQDFETRHLLQLVGTGLCATVGQYFLTRAFTSGDPSRLSVVSLTQIVFVLVLDVVVLEHRLQPMRLLGLPLILGPTAWLMSRGQGRAPIAVAPAPVQSNASVDERRDLSPPIGPSV